jgi:hypothetical protein
MVELEEEMRRDGMRGRRTMMCGDYGVIRP